MQCLITGYSITELQELSIIKGMDDAKQLTLMDLGALFRSTL